MMRTAAKTQQAKEFSLPIGWEKTKNILKSSLAPRLVLQYCACYASDKRAEPEAESKAEAVVSKRDIERDHGWVKMYIWTRSSTHPHTIHVCA